MLRSFEFIAVLTAAVGIILGSPQVAARGQTLTEGQLLTAELPSAILKRPIRASIYLPAAHQQPANANRRFPVVYLLHGHGDDHTAWPRQGRIKPTLDRMLSNGELQPVIVVMPDARKSWYVNDARTGAASNGAVFDAFRTDLIDAVDARYRTIPCPTGRAIGGLSMGGYGALLLGTAHPVRFAATFSLSGALYSGRALDDPARSVLLRRLFGGVHGEPIRHQRLKDWNIFGRLRAIKSPELAPHVWISAGDHDFFPTIVTGSVTAYDILRRKRVPAELRIDDAGHTWSYWRRSVVPALAWASERLRSCSE